jgi:guanyl-specific ribonuclease Sa
VEGFFVGHCFFSIFEPQFMSAMNQFVPASLLRILLFVVCWLAGDACRTDHRHQDYQQASQQEAPQHHKKHHRKSRQQQAEQYSQKSRRQDLSTEDGQQGDVPSKVRGVLAHVRQHGRAPDGYVGGRTFGNYENHLPKQDGLGKRICYQEWDVNPKIRGQNRGAERLITGSDNRAYYTRDHYNSFIEIK